MFFLSFFLIFFLFRFLNYFFSSSSKYLSIFPLSWNFFLISFIFSFEKLFLNELKYFLISSILVLLDLLLRSSAMLCSDCWIWTSQKNVGYFAGFKQVKNLVVILLTLNKSKIKLTTKLLWEKLDAWAFFFFFFLAITSCHWHSTLASQTCESLHQPWALPGH